MKELREANVVNLAQVREAVRQRNKYRISWTRVACWTGAFLFIAIFWVGCVAIVNVAHQPQLDQPTNYSVAPEVLRVSPGE